jgi:hypothetical protein
MILKTIHKSVKVLNPKVEQSRANVNDNDNPAFINQTARTTRSTASDEGINEDTVVGSSAPQERRDQRYELLCYIDNAQSRKI